MGAVVIGGLLASTALSLLFVPAFSLLLDKAGRWKPLGKHAAAPPPMR